MRHVRTPSKGRPLRLSDFRAEQAPPRHELRREPRVPCEGDSFVAVLRCSDAHWCFRPVRLVDCSPHGLGLIDETPMKAGEQLLVKLRLGGRRRVLVYTVRHCAPMDGGWHRMGAEFLGVVGARDEPDADDVLEALLEAAS